MILKYDSEGDFLVCTNVPNFFRWHYSIPVAGKRVEQRYEAWKGLQRVAGAVDYGCCYSLWVIYVIRDSRFTIEVFSGEECCLR